MNSFRSARTKAFAQQPLRLNLGSGPTGPVTWVNLDHSPTMLFRRLPLAARLIRRAGLIGDDHLVTWERHIVRQNLVKPLPFDDGSVDAIYSSHFLEHIYCADAESVLQECHRVLRPGGMLRLALPDGVEWARQLIEAGDDDAGTAARHFNFVLGAYPTDRPRGVRKLITIFGGHNHRWQPTPGLVRSMLVKAGFLDGDIADRKFLEGDLPDLADIETRDESFFIEARR